MEAWSLNHWTAREVQKVKVFNSAGLVGFFPVKATDRDFPGGAVVKNPPANAGDTGSSPGPGGSHMPRSN